MPGPETMTVTTPNDREIEITRGFDAPRSLVFDAFTKPELLKRWGGGPPGWSMVVCEVDLRVGGAWRQVLRGPAGEEMGMGGVHREVVAPERVVRTEVFDQAWYAGEAVGTMVLTQHGTKTSVRITVRYDSKEVRDGVLKSPMESGMAAGFNAMAELLAELQRGQAQ